MATKTILQLGGPLALSLSALGQSYIEVETEDNQSFHASLLNVVNPVKIITLPSSLADAGNTPTTTIRKYHVLTANNVLTAVGGSSGIVNFYDPDNIDGLQTPIGILAQDTPIPGVATQAYAYTRGVLNWSSLITTDPDFKDERLKMLLARNFTFADLPYLSSHGAGWQPERIYRRSSNTVLQLEDSGSTILATGDVEFSLPTVTNNLHGCNFHLVQVSDNRMILSSPASNIIFAGNLALPANAAASELVFNVTGHKIGTELFVRLIYVGTNTLKWLVTSFSDPYHLSGIS